MAAATKVPSAAVTMKKSVGHNALVFITSSNDM
jgi:hypothetical protein